MALSITHPFVSPVTDLGEPEKVGPDEWNAAHSLSGTLDAAQMPALTGDVTTPGASLATTLATVNGNVGTFGSATAVAQVTYNAKGLATAAADVTITPAVGSITGLGTGVGTFLETPSSANLAAALTDETGSGAAVFATSPTLVTPILGTPTSVTLTNGTGLPISTGVSGLGTGVATALAVNVGSAGAPVLFNGAGGTPTSLTLTNATGLPVAGGGTGFTTQLSEAIEFIIDGGGDVITTGVKGFLEIPFACTITRATLLADQSGSIVVDIWKDTYANYPPTDADSITASAPPTITTATKSQDATLTGWTVSVASGDILGFNVDSVTTLERVTLSLKVTRTSAS